MAKPQYGAASVSHLMLRRRTSRFCNYLRSCRPSKIQTSLARWLELLLGARTSLQEDPVLDSSVAVDCYKSTSRPRRKQTPKLQPKDSSSTSFNRRYRPGR